MNNEIKNLMFKEIQEVLKKYNSDLTVVLVNNEVMIDKYPVEEEEIDE